MIDNVFTKTTQKRRINYIDAIVDNLEKKKSEWFGDNIHDFEIIFKLTKKIIFFFQTHKIQSFSSFVYSIIYLKFTI